MLALTPFRRTYLHGYDPFREFERLERRLFENRMPPDFRIDIREEGDIYIMEADLPGFDKADIRIELEGTYMTVRAERTLQKGEEQEGKYLCSERSFGVWERTFDISGVDGDSLHASYKNGVLTVTMPKKKAKVQEKRSLEVE